MNNQPDKPVITETLDHLQIDDMEARIELLDPAGLTALVDVVQQTIENNHHRLMGLSASGLSTNPHFQSTKRKIMRDNHYLAGEVLPKLYHRLQNS